MSTLLRIDSSPLAGSASFSRQLTDEFVHEWQSNHPGGRVIVRDLSATPLRPIDAEWIGAAYAPEPTPAQKDVLRLSDELIAELKAADEYVFGVSMHNFSIPGVLKLWIDQVARPGQTFSYENGVPEGLLHGKTATFLVATGGIYDKGSPREAMNHIEPYLTSLFTFLGVTDVRFINAGGTVRARFGVDPGAILQPAIASIHAQFHTA